MRTLYLVRHGQASFGADNYDQLSTLGQRQCHQLGAHWAAKGMVFDAVLCGTLNRHSQSVAHISAGLKQPLQAQVWPGLDEYDSAAIIATLDPAQVLAMAHPNPTTHHFRQLRFGLMQWMLGRTQPAGMPSWATFAQQVVAVLDHVRQSDAKRVLLVSSGGPIACAIGHVLGTPPEATVELNMRLRNTAVSEFTVTPKRHALLTFNTINHLDALAFADWATHV